MQTIKAILVDDELNSRKNLAGLLQKHCPEIKVIGETASAIEAINAIESQKPDLVFLDIEMPGGNGFEVLDYFKNPSFYVIFVTAYDQYAIQAIRFAALDYILKPIDALKIKSALQLYSKRKEAINERVSQFLKNKNLPAENKKIALPFSDKIEFVEVKDIVKCQGETNYTRIYLADGKMHMVSKSLIEYEEILAEFGFIRTHKSFIVNKIHITSFVKNDGGYLLLSDKSNVPVSRRRKEYVLEQLK